MAELSASDVAVVCVGALRRYGVSLDSVGIRWRLSQSFVSWGGSRDHHKSKRLATAPLDERSSGMHDIEPRSFPLKWGLRFCGELRDAPLLVRRMCARFEPLRLQRSEEHTSELQSH